MNIILWFIYIIGFIGFILWDKLIGFKDGKGIELIFDGVHLPPIFISAVLWFIMTPILISNDLFIRLFSKLENIKNKRMVSAREKKRIIAAFEREVQQYREQAEQELKRELSSKC